MLIWFSCSCADPFLNDATYFTSVLTLEELGATGNKGLALQMSNPVLANGVAGLATSATAQATIERFVLWNMRCTFSPIFQNQICIQPTCQLAQLPSMLQSSEHW